MNKSLFKHIYWGKDPFSSEAIRFEQENRKLTLCYLNTEMCNCINNCPLFPSIINDTISCGAAWWICTAFPSAGSLPFDWSWAGIDPPPGFLCVKLCLGWSRRSTPPTHPSIRQYVSADVLLFLRAECSVCTCLSHTISSSLSRITLSVLMRKDWVRTCKGLIWCLRSMLLGLNLIREAFRFD